MKRAISKHLRDFLAILFMIVVAAGVAGYILSNQRFYLPAWVPVVGTDFYEIEAELETAQAVVPGQGQTVNIAGVKVGEIGTVELEDGAAVVDMKIKRKYAPVYKDATILLRPKTAAQGHVPGARPGQPAGRARSRRAARVPVGQHAAGREHRRVPRRAGHRHAGLPAGAAQLGRRGASKGTRRPSCARRFKRFEPTARDARKVTGQLSKRRTQHPARDPQLPGAVHRAGLEGPPAGRVRRLGQRQLRGHRQPGAQPARGACGCCPARSTETRDTLRTVGRRGRRPRARAPEAAPRRARAGARRCARSRPFRARPRPSSATSCGRSPATSRPAVRDTAQAAEDLVVVTPRLTSTVRGPQLALQHARLQPERQRGGLPVLGRRGSTTPARRSAAPRTRTGRCGAGSCSSAARRSRTSCRAAQRRRPRAGPADPAAQPADRPTQVCPRSGG